MANVNLVADFGDIKGESKISGHEELVQVYDLRFNVKQKSAPTTGTGRTQSRAIIGAVEMLKPMDAASTYLALSAMRGDHIPKIIIYWNRDSGGERIDILEVTLEDCVISEYSIEREIHDTTREEILTERIGVSFGVITYLYRQQGDDGAVASEHETTFNLPEGV